MSQKEHWPKEPIWLPVFGLGIALVWTSKNNGRCLFFDLKDVEVEETQIIEKIKLSRLLVQSINEFKMNEIQRKSPQ